MSPKLLAEFPHVTYDAWRKQVDKDLKGADFDKRLLTRTPEGIVVQPLYTARDIAPEPDAGGFAGLPPYRRGGAALGKHGQAWDVRAEQRVPDPKSARQEIAEDLRAGATSLWLRFAVRVRTGSSSRTEPDGLCCERPADLDALLADVDLARTAVALDAGAHVGLAALYLAHAERKGIESKQLTGSLGCDPLGALARDGSLPFDLPRARSWLVELSRHVSQTHPQLRAADIDSEVYHLAGAHAAQEIGYALATGVEYLRWGLDDGLSSDAMAKQLGFRVAVASDLFLELAKLRALRMCWAKVVAAHGGSAAAQSTQLHAVTSLRTKTRRDPWVNMLRTTTEAFAAMVGGADAVTTRAFDVALGQSDEFARRIARNAQLILNEEAHVTQVADAAGGSYYVESLTDQLARSAWQIFQDVERRGGMTEALSSGSIAQEIAESAHKREQAIAKRVAPLTGVSEFASLTEAPVRREHPVGHEPVIGGSNEATQAAVAQLSAAGAGAPFKLLLDAARAGATLPELSLALSAGTATARLAALPVRPQAAPYEALRDRSERHAAKSGGQLPRAFLCNLGEIPQHKARSSFATGFLNAGGIVALDNDGFNTVEDAVEAFVASCADTLVVCGSDDQYVEWVPKLAPALRERGARQIIVAGRPGDQQASYEQAGVHRFIFVGADVVATLSQVLDAMGVDQ